MDKREFRKNAADMIYLTACAINGKKPKQERIDALDLPKLFEVCQKHILTACVAYALESVGIQDHEFTQAKEKSIRKNILLDAERAKILQRLEEEKIWYMPLKGSILKDWYPKLGMRQMSDNDILFESEKRKDVYDIFTGSGFSCNNFGDDKDDAYFKAPIFNFEMHCSLFSSAHIGKFFSYFENVKERLIKNKDQDYGFHFKNEDFYLYMISHEYRHFLGSGTGVRSLVDTYVFLRKFGNSLDWEYINYESEKLEISDFERNNRELATKTFSLKKLNVEEKKLLDYYVLSGVYGNITNSVKNGIKYRGNGSKIRYLLFCIFPPINYLETSVPWVGKSKLLIPFAYIYRLIKGIAINRKKIAKRFLYIGKTQK